LGTQHRSLIGRAILWSLLLHALALALLPGWHIGIGPADSIRIRARVVSEVGSHSQPEDIRVERDAAPRSPRTDASGTQGTDSRARPARDARPIARAPLDAEAAVADEPQSSATDGGTLSQWRAALLLKARDFRRYPLAAIEYGWQGRIDLWVGVAADGRIESVQVRSGSGHAALDAAAAEMAADAASQVPIPPSLRGRAFGADLAVAFSLTDVSTRQR